MGCESSFTQARYEIGQNLQKKYCTNLLSTNHKKQLLEIIQYDDVCEFAVFISEKHILINSQLSEQGIYWMVSHFCCRWDSQKILDYALKTAYIQNPKQYIRFINEQTLERQTCLHLCITWNAIECLKVLLKYGGVHLQLKDKTQATPYLSSVAHKRKEIKEILETYQNTGMGFVSLNHQLLTTGQIMTLQNNTHKLNLQKINQDVKDVFTNIFLKTQEEDNLLFQKNKIQAEKQQIRFQIKKIEEQESKKQVLLRKSQEQQLHIKQRQLLQVQHDLVQKMKVKDEQLERVKNAYSKLQYQKKKALLAEQQKKMQKFLISNQSIILQRRQLQKQVIQQKKQVLVKNYMPRESSRATTNAKTETSGKCPQNLLSVYEEAKSKGYFIDSQFPPKDSSMGNNDKAKKILLELAWLRPNEIFKGDYFLFNGIDANDIRQGSLGVCYMLATLSTLAQESERIRNLFVFHDRQVGFYVLRLLINGEIRQIVVDDYFPCNRSTKTPLFAKPVDNQLWVCLIEKAWAKCIGNYLKAQSMTPYYLMQDLTLSPSFGVWFKDCTQKTKQLQKHIKLQNIVVLTSISEGKIQGIVNSHAYSLLEIYNHNKQNIYKIRNPWGRFEWNGQYGQKSLIWTEQLKKKLNFVELDDGIFFLSQNQLLQAFVYYSVCLIRNTYKYQYVGFTAQKNQSRYYTFQLDQDQEINLRFVQKFQRMLNDPNYKYSPVIFQVGRIENDETVTFLAEGNNACFWGAKSVHANEQILKKYQKGKYFVRIAVQWVDQNKYNSGFFAIFAPKNIKITQLSLQNGSKYQCQLMKNFALNKTKHVAKTNMKYAMVWMRGQLVCCAYALQTQKAELFEAKWTFTPQNLNNCVLGYNNEGNDLIFKMGKGVKNANLGTLNRTLINAGCSSGSVVISATPL